LDRNGAADLVLTFTTASLLVNVSIGRIASLSCRVAFVSMIAGIVFAAAAVLPLLKKRAAGSPPLL
jgi:hypothetical protein